LSFFPQAIFLQNFSRQLFSPKFSPANMFKLFNPNSCDKYQQWLQLTFMKVNPMEKPQKLNVLQQK